MAVVIPDFMPDVRYWLRTHPDLAPFHAGRVFFRIPDAGKVSGGVLMRLYRIGGGIADLGGDAPISTFDISIECWCIQTPTTPDPRKLYTTVRQMADATVSALFQVIPGSLLNPTGQTRALNALATTVIDSPDPETGDPRMVVDSRWTFAPL